MAFWDLFTNKSKKDDRGTIFSSLKELLPEESEELLEKLACIAGLHARIAFADLEIDPSEEETIRTSLTKWFPELSQYSKEIANISIHHTKELAGIENHKYCGPLLDLLSLPERYNLFKSLFYIAAADEKIEEIELHELKTVARALGINHQKYVAAKIEVMKK